MTSKAGSGGLPAAVLQARKRLLEGRQKLRAQHDSGSPGLQVCVRLADLVDSVLLELYQASLADLTGDDLAQSVALVAHGGYGRRDVAPYSDVDLMLLHDPRVTDAVVPLARRLSQWIVDAGANWDSQSARRFKLTNKPGPTSPALLRLPNRDCWLAATTFSRNSFVACGLAPSVGREDSSVAS